MLQDRHNGAQGYWIRLAVLRYPGGRGLYGQAGRWKTAQAAPGIYDTRAGVAMLEMKQERRGTTRRSARPGEPGGGRTAGRRPVRLPAEPRRSLHGGVLWPADAQVLPAQGGGGLPAQGPYRAGESDPGDPDHQIRASETCMDLFNPALNTYPVLPSFHGVLEVKYNGFLLSYIKEAVSWADRSEISVSKYCLARSATMHFSL